MRLTPHHVGLIVSDLERSKWFYGQLGFEVAIERTDEKKTLAFMRLGDFELELFCYNETPPAADHEGPVLGFRHLALRTDDIDDVMARLGDAGVLPPDAQVRDVPGMARLLFFNDPDGIEIEVMQPL
jgi:catechol 2,3-dioxygenase-like lactoylglutathione lyase family enzyme